MSATNDLTRPDHGQALDRLTGKVSELGDEAPAYLILCMGILARNAPDVCTFLMDRADQSIEAAVVLVCPECNQGKHQNCTEFLLDEFDNQQLCQCDVGEHP